MRISTVVAGFIVAVAFTLSARPAAAQQAEALLTPVAAIPALDAASVAVRSPASDVSAAPLLQRRGMRRSTTLMILGGAIFLAGALIGDDAGTLIMVGGAATALYGLYLYLDQDRLTAQLASPDTPF